MKRFISLVHFTFFTSIITFAQAPSWQWANRFGGASSDAGMGIGVDSASNVYVLGMIDGVNANFGSINIPGPAATLAKYDPAGNVVWALELGDPFTATGPRINVQFMETDLNGNCYITGFFSCDSARFGNTTLYNPNPVSGNWELFLLKTDNNGNVIWAIGSQSDPGVAYLTGLAIDDLGNAYVTGDLTPSATTIHFGSDSVSYSNPFQIHSFILKVDAVGTEQWLVGAQDIAKAVGVNDAGTLFVAFKPEQTAPARINTYDANGVAQTFTTFASYNVPSSIDFDMFGNVYLCGTFSSATVTFGSYTLSNVSNSNDIFLVKYSMNATVLWARSAGSTSSNFARAQTDSLGNTVLAGIYQGTGISFGSWTLTNQGSTNVCVAFYDNQGTVYWAQNTTNGGSSTYCWDLCLDPNNNDVLITGWHGNFSSIDFGSYTLSLYSNNYSDAYVASLGNQTLATTLTAENSGLHLSPNPTSETFQFYFTDNPGEYTLTITDALGRILVEKTVSPETVYTESINMPGVYFVAVRNSETESCYSERLVVTY